MKVLSLAWKYHPSITSGVGVACEGLNNALSKIVELIVIYPKVSSVTIREEVLLSSEDLSDAQKRQIEKEYIEVVEKGMIELAVRFDPYFVSSAKKESGSSHHSQTITNKETSQNNPEKIKVIRETEKLLFDEVDIFGESVRDKIFVYNRLVEELAEGIDFDIIHAHDWMTFLAGISVKDKFNKPLVLHVHSLEYDRVGHKDASWVYDVERFAMSKADRVISASNYTKGIIESNYGLSQNHIKTIYNAITLPEKIDEEALKSHEKFKVLFAGRIDGNKGIEYFIDIARLVLQQSSDVEFIVVGRGVGNVTFEEIPGFHEIEKNFQYLGFVEREELFGLYKSCDVLCMPSISEPFGLTAIEAAYMNLPVILSNKTGASEILKRTPKANFWDTKKFADHILSMKNNNSTRKRVITNNKKDIKNLSWDSSARQVLEVFNEIFNR